MSELLHVDNLHVHYRTQRGPVKAVNGVSFALGRNQRLGLVGESGSGKSTMALALMRLLTPPGEIVEGNIYLEDQDLAHLSEEEMRRMRLESISMIPQGAMNSLNPVTRIRDQIIDGLVAHNTALSQRQMRERVHEVLEWVDLDPAVATMYPHELSGGMKQRVCIAIAIAMHPKLIIADEPTSALDVVVQRQVMETISQVQADLDASVILIGHDMGLMVQFVDVLIIMYAGRIAEIGTIEEIFTAPRHPYTQMLIDSLPTLETKGVFRGIPGIAPSLLNAPEGCLFHPRCPKAMDVCLTQTPPLEQVDGAQRVACHLY